MSALYAMRYRGAAGVGAGALYIGKGLIVGVDVNNGRYSGLYKVEGDRFRAEILLTMPTGGALVTGDDVAPGTAIPIVVDWPKDFANGQPQDIAVGGESVKVVFEMVGDIP